MPQQTMDEKLVSPVKNPLAVAFGSVLRELRNDPRMKLSRDQVASQLGISNSLYRLVETGGAPLQSWAGLRLVVTFRVLGIRVEPLGILLSLINALSEKRLGRSSEKSQGLPGPKKSQGLPGPMSDVEVMRDGLKSYAEENTSEPLRQILVSLKRVIAHDDDVTDQKRMAERISECNLIDQVRDFLFIGLESGDTPRTQKNNLLENLIASVPSFYLPVIEELVAALNTFPPGTTADSISIWEDRNASLIRRVDGVVEKLDDLYIEDVTKFTWRFLSGSQFRKLRLAITRENPSQESRDRYFQELAKYSGVELEDLKSLVHVDYAKPDEIENFKSLGKTIMGSESDGNLWLYEVESGLAPGNTRTIGFADNFQGTRESDKPQEGQGATIPVRMKVADGEQTQALRDQIDEFWKNRE